MNCKIVFTTLIRENFALCGVGFGGLVPCVWNVMIIADVSEFETPGCFFFPGRSIVANYFSPL